MNQLVGLEALRARVPAALRRTVDQLLKAVDELAEELGGERVSTPAIGVVTRWEDVDHAARFAVRVQLELLRRDWPTTLLLRPEAAEIRSPDGKLLYRGPRVRTAVHAGTIDVIGHEDGPSVVGGPGIYQLARILATLHAGQTVLSGAAWDALTAPPEGAIATDLGNHALIGVQGSTRLHQLVPVELAARSFPPPRSREHTRTNAPVARGSFVGRDGDLQALSELVGFGLRAITVLGEPGVGKSDLLHRFMSVQAGEFTRSGAGGAWICEVEGSTASHVVASLASTLGISLRFGRSLDELLRQLGIVMRRRGRTLLALDGIATDPAELSRCLEIWLATAPELTVLVAARSRLGLRGEIAYQIAPLPRVQPEGARNADAVRLFVERAQQAAPRFQAADPATLASVVNLLGGNPLAISLTAGLAAKLGADGIHAEIEQIDGSLDSVVDLVWRLLDESERHVLSCCAVYPAGFDQVGAEAVVDTRETGVNASESLSRLARNGMVIVTEDARTPDIQRFRVHGLVRSRALADLPTEERTRLERRAALRVLSLCEPWSTRAWGGEGPEVLGRLAIEWVNLGWIAERAGRPDASSEDVNLALRACSALWPLVSTAGPAELFARLVGVVLERADVVLDADPYYQVRALGARSGARRNVGDLSGARADAERGAEIAGRWGDAAGEGLCRLALGRALHAKGRYQEAARALELAAALLDETDPGHAAATRAFLVGSLLEAGDAAGAEAAAAQASPELARLKRRRHLGLLLASMGALSQRRGDLEHAAALLEQSCDLSRQLGDQRALALSLSQLAACEASAGQLDAAGHTLEAALEAAQEAGFRSAEARVRYGQGRLALVLGDVTLAREHLLAAMAIDRDLRDRHGEAEDTAWLGIAHHVSGHLQGARDSFERALRGFGELGSPRKVAQVLAWKGAVEAADHEVERSRASFQRARERAEASRDPVARAVVALLEGVLDIVEAESDPSARERALQRIDAVDVRDVEVRIARSHLARLLEFGLTTG